MFKKLTLAFVILGAGIIGLLFYLVPSGFRSAPAGSLGERPSVVTTQSIIEDWVSQISLGRVRLESLVDRGANVHHFEPKPAKAIALGRSDLLIELGLGLEDEWLTRLYKSSNSHAKRIVLSAGLPALRASASWDGHAHHASASPGRQEAPLPPCCQGKIRLPADLVAQPHDEVDPHVWLDVAYTRCMVKTLYEALSALDPKSEPFYKKNWETYDRDLRDLDAEIREKVKKIPEKNRILVSHHDSLRYFALAYGFFDLGNATGSTSGALQDTSAGHLAQLIEEIKKQKVQALFPEAGEVPVLLQQISSESGVPLAPEIYVGSLSHPRGPASTYIALMRHLVNTLADALK